jgi:hypothetical protein
MFEILGTVWHLLNLGFDTILLIVGAVLIAMSWGVQLDPRLAIVGRLLGPAIRYVGFGAVVYGGGQLYVAYRVSAALQEQVVKEELAVAKARVEEQERGDKAVLDLSKQLADAQKERATIKEIIRNVPVQSACTKSPVIAAGLVDPFLRGTAASGDKASRTAPIMGLWPPPAIPIKPN